MDGKAFDVRLILEFSGTMTDMPIVEWIENEEIVYELCAMDKVERIFPLQLRGSALAVYRRLSKEQRANTEQIKQAHTTAYATDKFNAFDQFVTRRLRPGETVDEFLLICIGGARGVMVIVAGIGHGDMSSRKQRRINRKGHRNEVSESMDSYQ